jgi:hypothetical protein
MSMCAANKPQMIKGGCMDAGARPAQRLLHSGPRPSLTSHSLTMSYATPPKPRLRHSSSLTSKFPG